MIFPISKGFQEPDGAGIERPNRQGIVRIGGDDEDPIVRLSLVDGFSNLRAVHPRIRTSTRMRS
jgi:hypothetical protein